MGTHLGFKSFTKARERDYTVHCKFCNHKEVFL